MNSVTFHFHGTLNDFLPHKRRNQPFEHLFDWRTSIKDMIESLGPPHCEVALILVDGVPVDFYHIVRSSCHVDIYAALEKDGLSQNIQLRPNLKERPRFVLDTHLGRLASYLRMMGFDTLYRNDYPDDELAEISNQQERILLTRDIGLLKRSLVIHGYWVRSTDPKKRIVEVLNRFDLHPHIQPFRHCIKCNGLVVSVEKQAIIQELPPTVRELFDEFHQCCDCGRTYWKGSHYDRMRQFMGEVTLYSG